MKDDADHKNNVKSTNAVNCSVHCQFGNNLRTGSVNTMPTRKFRSDGNFEPDADGVR